MSVGALVHRPKSQAKLIFFVVLSKTKGQIAAALCAAVFCAAFSGLTASSSLAAAQQKTAKACLEEWRASKAARDANGITQKAHVARCRAGGTPIQAAAAPATPAAAADGQVHSSIKDLMESIIDPSADALWGAVGTVVDKEGIHESAPKTQEEWLDMRRAAVRIIEGGNLLMMPGRQAAPIGTKSEAPGVELEPAQITALINNDRKSFDAFARALRALGAEALRASEARNAGMLMDIGAEMESVCESCHQVFWYPPQKRTTP